MLRYGLLLALSVLVSGAMAAVLVWFARRLTRIEKERWGRPMGYGRPPILDRFLERRRARDGTGREGSAAS